MVFRRFEICEVVVLAIVLIVSTATSPHFRLVDVAQSHLIQCTEMLK